ncbi:MAG: ribonuclease HI family protein [Actinomycetota bacterium]|nr:ribonuclease HI family protein [Actinomycetota bacterium]
MRALPADPGLLIVACDGAARGNPGPAGIGVHITTPDGVVVAEIGEGIGETTNNVAEYAAAVEGLKRAAELGATEVLLRSDSQLLINQLSGVYRVKSPHLQPLHRAVREQAARFAKVRFEHVPRERNTEADRLANVGVDAWLAARGR